ncbi:hypothetical protein ACFV97_14000 [Streptomyces sp. NPDC059913]|uniref:hypothetical protein n=1 Tax=unclassified Streptomyces TaxID=2593676 RepID=UPI00364E553E
MTVTRVAASATAEFDLTTHWKARERGRDGWKDTPALTRELSDCFTGTVRRAVEEVGDALDRDAAEIVTATWYGTSHVAEVMHEQLHEAGPKWLNPEQFLYYSPHSVVSAAALALGIGGAGSTLLGPDSEFQALKHAVRRLASGRVPAVVVAEYEALTPFAALGHFDGPGLPYDGGLPTGRVTALVLMADGRGPEVRVHRGVADAAARRPAERHGAVNLPPGPGLLRALAGARAPAVVLAEEADRHAPAVRA